MINAEDLDVVMSMYYLSEYCPNHINDHIPDDKSFEYTKIVGKNPAQTKNEGDAIRPAVATLNV